jgi:hypothetical protein
MGNQNATLPISGDLSYHLLPVGIIVKKFSVQRKFFMMN